MAAWVLLSALARPSEAEVVGVSASGFEVREQASIAASPATVYQAAITPSAWWDAAHSYSGSLTLDARAGGCWCETLPGGGSVQHMVVVNAMPGKLLRLRGALGPLQGMGVEGALSIRIESGASGAQVSLTYAVGGYSARGFEELSKGVDQVLALQLERLKRLIETGRPTAQAP
ncbi:MAG TPA: SRPBCC family protein [Steroidobacteraceae bacterium]|nr:SRPBCC family protein [Steroidobacteraceae bacterium]